jgi:putative FmdB family regulatory protein
MPTYPYRCEACEKEFDEVQKISDPPLKKCKTPGCRGVPTRQIGRGTSFVLNGEGWYRDGYSGGKR